MTTQASTKVRLVRCPKCRQVLAELPEVLLYKCGGCGTVLQAKNRKTETNHTGLSAQETDAVGKPQLDNVSEEKEARSLTSDLPKVESSQVKDHIRYQDEDESSNMGLSEDRSVSGEISSSPEVNSSWDGDSSVEVQGSVEHEKGELMSRNSKRYISSSEFTREPEVSTPEAPQHEEQHEKSWSHQVDRVQQVEGGGSQRVSHKGGNFIEEDRISHEHENQENVLSPRLDDRERMNNKYVPPENDDEKSRFTDETGEFHGGLKHVGLDSSPRIENDSMSQSGERSNEVVDDTEGLPIFRSLHTRRNTSASVGDSKSLVSFYLSSPDDEDLDHSLDKETRNFGRVSSVDTLGSSPLAEPSSELRLKNGNGANCPRTGSYYAYDGSESSYDGTDDQIFEQISHLSRKNKHSEYISPRGTPRTDRLRVNNVVNSEPEMNYWAASSSHNAIKSRDKYMETYSDISGDGIRLDKREAVSNRLPFNSRDTLVSPRILSPTYRLPPNPGFHSSDKPSYSEADKMDLLRTVYELKDQLSRMHFPEAATKRRFSAGVEENFASFHHNRFAPQSEMYSNLNHPRGYDLSHHQVNSWSGQSNVPGMAFSGEAAHYRHQVNCSCLHCCPPDWRYSAQSPSNCVHCKNGHCVVPIDHYTSSELALRGSETKSGNQRRPDDEMKRLYLKEKYNTTKKHLRPVAGGAPVVSCYHCSELLQLPADFLLFKKRKYHQLMCNACRKVLKFSFLKTTHIVPYSPDDGSAPPPSEADDYNNTTAKRNFETISQSNSSQNAEPVFSPDDYGRSCSTEGYGSVLPPYGHVGRDLYNRKKSPGSSYEPREDRKMKSISREVRDKNESSVGIVESVGASPETPKWSKRTSEIDRANSPLHRLMGYKSPSQVLDK